MTFHKYLVTFGLLLTGWSAVWAADDTTENGSSASGADTSSASSTGTPKSTHHRKHHGTKSAAGATTNAPAASTTAAASSTSTSATATPKTKGAPNTAKPASASASTSTEPGAKGATADATSHTTSKRHHHKGTTQDAASGSGTSAQPPATGASGSASAATASAPVSTVKPPTATVSSHGEKNSKTTAPASVPASTAATAGTATTAAASATAAGKPAGSHRRHHGKTTEAATTTAAAPAVTGTNVAPSAPATPSPATVKAETPAPAAAAPGVPPATVAPIAATTSTTSAHHRRHHGKSTTPEPVAGAPAVVPVPSPATPAVVTPAPAPPPASSAIAVPTVQTALPVARPGAGTTATLPLGLHRGSASTPVTKFPFTDYPTEIARPRTRTYPWKNGIITTVFWIGEGGTTLSATTNHASSWDMDWTYHNGGVDDPEEMSKKSGYSFDTHASTLNPFYIALPFNDLAYPEKAQRWLPSGWYKPQRHGQKPVSACQGRWVEIKSGAGRVCYAQWEDVGPLVSDHAEYVFGPERPTTLTRAGLDVSPAVAKYLGFDSTAMTSWRFVDDADVQPGMWLRYDEQAILFRALKEEMHPRSNPRLQDLDEPVPDGSMQDDSEKRAGAARG